jgi:hypothetical protein
MRLGGSKTSTFTVVPRVTYTKPEVASCGLSKELALRFYGKNINPKPETPDPKLSKKLALRFYGKNINPKP